MKSAFFDSDWYLAQYPDVAASGVNPLEHFVVSGAFEGRDPSPFFDSDWYLAQYPDVAASGMNPLEHFVVSGAFEGRDPSPLFRVRSIRHICFAFSPLPIPKALSVSSDVTKQVAIVVPVFGQWHYTDRCLRSLIKTEAATNAHVYVVDDCGPPPPEHIRKAIDEMSFVTLLRNPVNLGFTLSCNQALREVNEDLVLLLNNDTEVLPGFLDELLATFERHSDAGIVGSRLVYPNGALQEAGGIIWRDGSGHNYGRNEDPDEYPYLFERAVDYCSGAAILFKKDFFWSIGGFDEQYAPAYYEDTDLAFACRKLGREVVYCPSSVVIHHEGGSHGRDETKGLKAQQVLNRQLFEKKWRKELSRHPESGKVSPSFAANSRPEPSRIILYGEATLPKPFHDSGSFRSVQLMKIMKSLGYAVYLHCEQGDTYGEDARRLRAEGICVLNHEKDLQSVVANERERLALIFGARCNSAIRLYATMQHLAPEVPFVFDTVDLHHLREAQQASMTGEPAYVFRAEGSKRIELFLAESSRVTVVVSKTEKDYLAREAPTAQVEIISNIHEICPDQTQFADRHGLVFVGSFQHPPNEDGLCWFLDEVWPILDSRIREGGIDIVGAHPPDSVLRYSDAQVRVHGWVQDTKAILSRARLSIAPLRYGAGVKGKVGEAWSLGLPVIGTSVALDGMVPQDSASLITADTARDLASLVSSAYLDEVLWNQAREIGLSQVREKFSTDVARDALSHLLAKVLP